MRHLNILFAAIGNIIRNKQRSLVIILCLVAVLFPFISAISIAEGVKYQALISVEQGADIYVTSDHYGSNAPIPLQYLQTFQSMEGIIKVFPRVVGRTYIAGQLITLVGIPTDAITQSIRLMHGTLYRKKGDVVIGKGLSKNCRLKVGEYFNIPSNTLKGFNVAGIFDSDMTIWSSNLMLMSFEDANEFFKIKGVATDICIYTRPGYATQLVKKLQDISSQDSSGPPLRMQDKSLVKRYFQRGFDYKAGVFTALFAVAFALAIPALLVVSGFSQSERKKEIGLLKATGWQTQEVIEMVFFENLVISLTSAPLSILMGMIWLKVFNGAFIAQFFIAEIGLISPFPVPSRFLPLPSFLAFLFAIILTMVGSLYSTWKTATIPPVEAMR